MNYQTPWYWFHICVINLLQIQKSRSSNTYCSCLHIQIIITHWSCTVQHTYVNQFDTLIYLIGHILCSFGPYSRLIHILIYPNFFPYQQKVRNIQQYLLGQNGKILLTGWNGWQIHVWQFFLFLTHYLFLIHNFTSLHLLFKSSTSVQLNGHWFIQTCVWYMFQFHLNKKKNLFFPSQKNCFVLHDTKATVSHVRSGSYCLRCMFVIRNLFAFPPY